MKLCMDRVATRTKAFPTTVFSEWSALAASHGAVNLGQGFPDFDGPQEVLAAAVSALREGRNQYAIGAGSVELRQAIADHAARFYNLDVDPETMISVTSGATEALFDACLGLIDPGDEVVLFEPVYDSFPADLSMAGGVARSVLLRPPSAAHPDWWFEPEELKAAFSPRTKLLILNTPHNPTGKVFDRVELELIADLCQRHDVLALCDEVYEHLYFEPHRHLSLATLPGMRERTVTIGSAGKTFGFTGWKVGWAIAAPPLRHALQQVHQWVTFATASPLQAAVAHGLRLGDDYFSAFRRDYQTRRNRLVAALAQAGLRPLASHGTYFVVADIDQLGFSDDVAFCHFLTRKVGVAGIPCSAFYLDRNKEYGRQQVRFAFCKKDETLTQATTRLQQLRDLVSDQDREGAQRPTGS